MVLWGERGVDFRCGMLCACAAIAAGAVAFERLRKSVFLEKQPAVLVSHDHFDVRAHLRIRIHVHAHALAPQQYL